MLNLKNLTISRKRNSSAHLGYVWLVSCAWWNCAGGGKDEQERAHRDRRCSLAQYRGAAEMNEGRLTIDIAEEALGNSLTDPAGREDYAAMEEATKKIAAGRTLYEPLPQTDEEAIEWKKFVPAWDACGRLTRTISLPKGDLRPLV